MSLNPRNKGKKGEYEWRDILNRTFKTNYARTPLSGGLDIKGDILKKYGSKRTIADEFHWEVKRVEKLNIHGAMRQAIRDARPPLIPCVAFRKNNEDWLICLPAGELFKLLLELEKLRGKMNGESKTNFERWIEKKEKKRVIRKRMEKRWKRKHTQ